MLQSLGRQPRPTGKRYLKAGYAPATINHTLTVVGSFYLAGR
ncbi:hypothetical protein [Streptomyces sp. NPDC020742]